MVDSGVVKLEDVETIFVNWKDIIACNNTFLRYNKGLYFTVLSQNSLSELQWIH
jgi:hypothetical protein